MLLSFTLNAILGPMNVATHFTSHSYHRFSAELTTGGFSFCSIFILLPCSCFTFHYDFHFVVVLMDPRLRVHLTKTIISVLHPWMCVTRVWYDYSWNKSPESRKSWSPHWCRLQRHFQSYKCESSHSSLNGTAVCGQMYNQWEYSSAFFFSNNFKNVICFSVAIFCGV